MRKSLKLFILLTLFNVSLISNHALADPELYQGWIQDMKLNPKGPFVSVRWFCNDGEILPPKAYACAKRGGGVQHGKLSKQAEQLRQEGYWVANLLAGVDTKQFIAKADFIDRYNQLLIEKFLISSDNGWILQKALFYRGAIQEEDEREGARQLLLALIAKPEWIGLRYPALRIGAQLLPHGEDTASVQKVRQMAASLADKDSGFKGLRVKIHGSPDASDAQSVRVYAEKISATDGKKIYLELADEIDRVYQAPPLPELLESNAKIFSGGPWLQKLLRDAAEQYQAAGTVYQQYACTSQLLEDLRKALPKIRSASARLRILDLSLLVEAENFKSSTEIRTQLSSANRAQRVKLVESAALSAYGTGAINQRNLQELQKSLTQLQQQQLPLKRYIDELKYLARAPGWSTQEMRFQFYQSMTKLAQIEPLVNLFIQDLLRGSPILFYSQVLDSLSRDANKLAGVTHQLFGKQVGVGFHALNPGLARGKLYAKANIEQAADFDPKGIYLLPETISELPPIAGIITVGEGNPLSHVQLLARNLGIPNVTVNESLLAALQKHDGEQVVMAVSGNGLVQIAPDGPQWDKLFGLSEQQSDVVIRPDLKKLDLSIREVLDMNTLRAADSGRIVGPKAAKLGELAHHYPNKVSKGIAIPFGIFREVVLEQPYKNSDQTVFDWMVGQYDAIQALPEDSPQRIQTTEAFRAELYDLISAVKLPEKYQQQLRQAMLDSFGNTTTGVFIRSDTNVEDLPGFTGAGLNLTLFNVVGFDAILDGISKVWASPFTARAFAWRQSHMQQPEHVYPAILILQSVANDKSGVLVTQDIDTGKNGILSVAVNEGVGGAVDGQSSESLRINAKDGSVRVLATATAPTRKVPAAKGGIDNLPVSGDLSVLKPDEIKQLIVFSQQLPKTFPPITDDQGNPAPADVEFGFYQGQLQLFQLRPFLQSGKTQGNSYLIKMDKALQGNMNKTVNMNEVPKS